MRLLFKINKELELMNYWGMINSNSYGNYNKELPPELVAKIRGKPFEEVEGIIRAQANRDYEAYERKIETVIRETRKAWELIDEEFYRRLEKIFKREFLAKKVIVYVTPLRRCNYNYNQDNPFFKISARSQPPKPQLKTAAHEQIHFMFHWHYQQHCESMLGRELTGHLKEALTFLINEEFQDLIGYEDQGYPEHKKLRERLTELWRTTKDLEVLIEQAIPITRECMNQ
ncbi:hypothetical protein J4438_03175 [Candidatus Woesearchaeota archaeon]|nr:hypothetical protein [Candidatus Woesearchaeota archaeon]